MIHHTLANMKNIEGENGYSNTLISIAIKQ
jgi:hypothetical protein